MPPLNPLPCVAGNVYIHPTASIDSTAVVSAGWGAPGAGTCSGVLRASLSLFSSPPSVLTVGPQRLYWGGCDSGCRCACARVHRPARRLSPCKWDWPEGTGVNPHPWQGGISTLHSPLLHPRTTPVSSIPLWAGTARSGAGRGLRERPATPTPTIPMPRSTARPCSGMGASHRPSPSWVRLCWMESPWPCSLRQLLPLQLNPLRSLHRLQCHHSC